MARPFAAGTRLTGSQPIYRTKGDGAVIAARALLDPAQPMATQIVRATAQALPASATLVGGDGRFTDAFERGVVGADWITVPDCSRIGLIDGHAVSELPQPAVSAAYVATSTRTFAADQWVEFPAPEVESGALYGAVLRAQSISDRDNGEGYTVLVVNTETELTVYFGRVRSGAFTTYHYVEVPPIAGGTHLRAELSGLTFTVTHEGAFLASYTLASPLFTSGQPGLVLGNQSSRLPWFSAGDASTSTTLTADVATATAAALDAGTVASGDTRTADSASATASTLDALTVIGAGTRSAQLAQATASTLDAVRVAGASSRVADAATATAVGLSGSTVSGSGVRAGALASATAATLDATRTAGAVTRSSDTATATGVALDATRSTAPITRTGELATAAGVALDATRVGGAVTREADAATADATALDGVRAAGAVVRVAESASAGAVALGASAALTGLADGLTVALWQRGTLIALRTVPPASLTGTLQDFTWALTAGEVANLSDIDTDDPSAVLTWSPGTSGLSGVRVDSAWVTVQPEDRTELLAFPQSAAAALATATAVALAATFTQETARIAATATATGVVLDGARVAGGLIRLTEVATATAVALGGARAGGGVTRGAEAATATAAGLDGAVLAGGTTRVATAAVATAVALNATRLAGASTRSADYAAAAAGGMAATWTASSGRTTQLAVATAVTLTASIGRPDAPALDGVVWVITRYRGVLHAGPATHGALTLQARHTGTVRVTARYAADCTLAARHASTLAAGPTTHSTLHGAPRLHGALTLTQGDD